MSIDRLKRDFAQPPQQHRFAPFWFLNHDLTEEETRWQIHEMHRQGVGGFILHARHGLMTPYMSEAWLRQIEVAVEEAALLGMKAYLYDENNWPSGPADARVIRERPEFRMSGVRLSQDLRVRPGERVSAALDFDDELVAVVAVPFDQDQPIGFPATALDLAAFVEGHRLDWRAPALPRGAAEGEWRVFVLSRRFFVGLFFGAYLDTLNPAAVKRFMALTHEVYVERLSEHMGGTIAGIFTDEPTMNFNGRDAIPWTPALPATFEWRKGYSLPTALPALFRDMGPATSMVRCDFYDVAADLYANAFFRQIYEFCDGHRLATMGHVMQEGELVEHVRQQGDWFRGARWMHWGGVDVLCELTWPSRTEHLNNLLGPKFASSAAHLLGKPLTGSECFGLAGQWGIDLKTLKWMTDWQVALGVNVLEPHAFYYSIQGLRKWECPPGEFYQSPFWPYYDRLAEHAGRLCALFSGGRHVADVAVLYPVRSMWATLAPHETPEAAAVVDNFYLVTKCLLRLNYDFDIVSEEMLQAADLRGGGIGIKGPDGRIAERYRLLVVPHVTAIAQETTQALERLLAGGGRVLCTGGLPTAYAEAGESEAVGQDMERLFGDIYEPSLSLQRKRTPQTPQALAGGWEGTALVGLPAGVDEGRAEAALGEALDSALDADVRVTDHAGAHVGDVVHLHYVKEGRDFYLFVNTSREQAHVFTADVAASGVPVLWNTETGEQDAMLAHEAEGGRLRFPVHLEPFGCAVVCVDPEADAPPVRVVASDVCVTEATAEAARGITREPGRHTVTLDLGHERVTLSARAGQPPAPIELTDTWEFETEKPNALPLTEWRLTMDAHVYGRDACGSANLYEATFAAEVVPEDARLLIDGPVLERVWEGSSPKDVRVLVNGQQVEGFERGEYLDHYILEADVADLLQQGRNTIGIRTAGHLYEPAALSHPAILVGSFALRRRGPTWRLAAEPGSVRQGSWSDQGYPHYCGIGIYRQTCRVPRRFLDGRVVYLEMDAVGDLADVWVNGKHAGVRCWPPFRVDVSDLLNPGANEVEIRVANALQNLLCTESKPSGILGPVRLVAYNVVEFPIGR